MLLSGGFIWRYREWERLREECPNGDPVLQRLVWERLDDALEWLVSLGAPVLTRDTENPLTTGIRFDPPGLAATLAAKVDGIRFGEPLTELPDAPVVLATGGFQANPELVREYVTREPVVLRAAAGGTGDGLRMALAAGGETSVGMDEFWGRAMPAPPAEIRPEGFRNGQSYARYARVENADGEVYEPRTWSEIDVAQWISRQPGGRAWFFVPDANLDGYVRDRTVADLIASAREAGALIERREGHTVVEVIAGITTTLGGLRVDTSARVADNVWACGADVGGISTGGWTSSLASALVLGLVAAESVTATS